MRCCFARLLSWLEQGITKAGLAGKHAKLGETFELRAGENGNALFSKSLIEAGTTLALIPLSRLLHSASLQSKSEGCSEPVRLASFLGLQRQLGQHSFWAPYIASLPSDHAQLPRYFEDSFMKMHFEGSLFPDFVRCRALEVKSRYEHITNTHLSSAVSWEDFQWSWDILDSRAASFPVESTSSRPSIVLFPLIDIAQHDDSPNISCHFDDNLQALRCMAVRRITPGDELLNSYFSEDLGNWEALERWGFTSTRMCKQRVAIQISSSASYPCSVPSPKTPNSIHHCKTFDLCNDPEDPSTQRFLDYLQLLAANADMREKLIGWSDQDSKQVTAFCIGRHLIANWLQAYPNDVSEDERLLDQELLDQRTRHAIILRRDEKYTLLWWLDFLKERSKQASSIEWTLWMYFRRRILGQ